MVDICQVRWTRRGRRVAGFTLVETLVALAIISVATGIFISLFGQSVELGQSDRSLRAAVMLAEARLADIKLRPETYQWPGADALASGKLAEVPPKGEVAQIGAAPATLPTVLTAAEREKNFFSRFKWRVFARVPDASSATCEVTVVVHWLQGKKDRSVCLTTEMERSKLEGHA